jgi:hypothetical protein
MVEVVQRRHFHQKALLACQKVDVSEGLASAKRLVKGQGHLYQTLSRQGDWERWSGGEEVVGHVFVSYCAT